VLRELRAAEPWVGALLASDGRNTPPPCVSAGVPLRVEELGGEAGDIVLMDSRCLHNTSANVSPWARLTVRLTCVRAETIPSRRTAQD